MARSTYIYVVQDAAWGGTVKAAFTVKHELITWLKQNPVLRFRVFRVADGDGGLDVTELAVRELLA